MIQRLWVAATCLVAALVASACATAGPLRGYAPILNQNVTPAASGNVSLNVQPTARTPLQPAIASAIASKPAGNVITVSAPSGNPFLLVQANKFTLGENLLAPPAPAARPNPAGSTWTGVADSGYLNWYEDGVTQSQAPSPPSGRVSGTDYTGTGATPRPILRIVTLPHVRYSTYRVVCADAVDQAPAGDPDMREGISKLRFYDEGAVLDVTSRKVYYYIDDAGVPRSEEGYCVTLDAAAHIALVPTRPVGTGRWEESLYVRAYSKNGTPFVTQLIGTPKPALSQSTTTPTWAAWLGFFPDKYDFAGNANITPSAGSDSCTKNADGVVWATDNFPTYFGCTFRTVEDLLAFQGGYYTVTITNPGGGATTITLSGTNAGQAWHGKFTETAFFDVWSTGGDIYFPAGRTVLDGCTPGVTATIGRASWTNFGNTRAVAGNSASATPISGRAPFTISGVDDSTWRPGTSGLLFDCVHFDHANLYGMGLKNYAFPNAEEATVHTNSYTSDDCTALGVDHDKIQGNAMGFYVFDSTFGCVSMQIGGYVVNNYFKGDWDDMFSGNLVTVGNLHESYDNAGLITAQNQISATYGANGGSATTASIGTNGSNGSTAMSITVTEAGQGWSPWTSPTVGSSSCGAGANLPCSTTANMLALLNAQTFAAGNGGHFTFAADVTPNDLHLDRNLKFMNGTTQGNIGTSAGSHTSHILTQIFPHSDWYQYVAPFMSNILVKNNLVKSINCTDLSGFRMDQNAFEVAFVQNVLRSGCAGTNGGGGFGVDGLTWGKGSDHVLVLANAMGSNFTPNDEESASAQNTACSGKQWFPQALDLARANVFAAFTWAGRDCTTPSPISWAPTQYPVTQDNHWYTTVPTNGALTIPVGHTGTQTVLGDNDGGAETFDGLFEAPMSWLFTPGPSGSLANQAHWIVPPAAIDVYGQTRAMSAPKGPAEPRITSTSYTDAQLPGVAITTVRAAHAATGTITLQWHTGAGETGPLQSSVVTITVNGMWFLVVPARRRRRAAGAANDNAAVDAKAA